MKVYQHVGPDFPGKCRAGQKEVSTQRLSPVASAQAGPEAAVAPMRALLTRLKRVPCLHRLWTEWIEGLLLGNYHFFGPLQLSARSMLLQMGLLGAASGAVGGYLAAAWYQAAYHRVSEVSYLLLYGVPTAA